MFQLNTDFLAQWAPRIAILLFCLPVHEFAHAWAANKLGDDTADQQGRLTLNPFVHLDIVGSIVLLFAGFGWAKPVPVDTRVFKHPRRDMALVAIAGPLSNIIMAAIMLAAVKVIMYTVHAGSPFPVAGAIQVLSTMLSINLVLACFNLLPVPPLDGSKFFGAIMPERYYFGMMRYERFVFPVLILLIFTQRLGPILRWMSVRMFAMIDFITMPIDLLLGG